MTMAAPSQTPAPLAYGPIPQPTDPGLLNRGYGPRSSSRPNSWVAGSSSYNVADPSPFRHNGRFREELDTASQRASIDGPPGAGFQRSASQASHSRSVTPSRATTLKKKGSLNKKGSVRRSGSKKSMGAGSVRSLNLGDKEKYRVDPDDTNSAFFVPIPTTGNPTDTLASRFQAWRKVLKDLIVFFKELQKSYESRSKLLLSASNVMGNTAAPPAFIKSGGLSDATEILRDFHRQGYLEANKAAEVESEVVNQLIGLRNDLQKKTKEIKNLSGDFRNSVDKEVDGTRKSIRNLHEALGLIDTDPSATSGRSDPFVIRLGVDKQIEKQIEEENYLHRAYLNLESSGRELESIVVSEIQKAYSVYASILKREADEAYDTAEKLRMGPISLPRDHEWNAFLANTDELVDPRVPLRNVESITYPGRNHPAAAEIRSGMLERKSKYLKSYTPGWYVLSPTHLHEFKSADRVACQTPVMSLYLPEQKLGTHSQSDSTSYKFMLKGRQTGAMHRGHSWVFRAESYETMMAWYEDIESLISKTGEARNAFVRRHVRSISGASVVSSDGVMDEDDEADRTPYAAESAVLSQERPTSEPRQAGGRFPSDVHIDRQEDAALSPSSGESSGEKNMLAAASSPPDGAPLGPSNRSVSDREMEESPVRAANGTTNGETGPPLERHDSYYGDWMGTARAPAKQQKLAQQADGDRRAVRSDGSNTSNANVAISGSTASREHSASPERMRRESASTVPTTTNVTDRTINTLPTSVNESHESEVVDFAGARHQQQSVDGSKDDQFSSGVEDTVPPVKFSEEPAPNDADTSPDRRRVRDSTATAFELQIPGRYPPNVVA